MNSIARFFFTTLIGSAVAMVPATESHALTCAKQLMPPLATLEMPTTLAPRGIVFVRVSDWKKVRDIAALVEVGRPDGPRWALEPAPSHASVVAFRLSSAGQMLLRPVTPLPVGKRVMLAPDFAAKVGHLRPRVIRRGPKRAEPGWLVVGDPAAKAVAKPIKLEATLDPADAKRPTRRSLGNPNVSIYSHTYTFEPAPPKQAVLIMVTADRVPLPNQGISRKRGLVRLFSVGPKLGLHQGHCHGNFPIDPSRTIIGFSFLDAEGRVVATASSLK